MPGLSGRGRNNIGMTGYLIHIFVISGLVILAIRLTPAGNGLRIHAIVSLALKVLAGMALGYFYWRIKGFGDTIGFHEEGLKLAQWAAEDFGAYVRFLFAGGVIPFDSSFNYSPRALYVSKWASVIYLAGPSSYWLSSVYFSLIAWAGLWTLTMVLVRIHWKWLMGALFSLMYFPSVLFWSSGLTKESLAVGALGVLLAALLSIGQRVGFRRWVAVILLILTGYILWQVKYYYAAVLLLSLIAGFILRSPQLRTGTGYRLLILTATAAAGWIFLGWLNPNLVPSYLPEVVYDQYLTFINQSDPGKYIEFSTLCPEWGCLILTLPFATLAGLFFPLPFDAWSVWTMLAGFENVVLIGLGLAFLISLRKSSSRFTTMHWSAWFYCLLLAGFLAMSAPNIGTLVRYRVGFLPVFLLLITLNNSYFCRWAEALKEKMMKLSKQ